jgi:hypothetical protein
MAETARPPTSDTVSASARSSLSSQPRTPHWTLPARKPSPCPPAPRQAGAAQQQQEEPADAGEVDHVDRHHRLHDALPSGGQQGSCRERGDRPDGVIHRASPGSARPSRWPWHARSPRQSPTLPSTRRPAASLRAGPQSARRAAQVRTGRPASHPSARGAGPCPAAPAPAPAGREGHQQSGPRPPPAMQPAAAAGAARGQHELVVVRAQADEQADREHHAPPQPCRLEASRGPARMRAPRCA